MPRVCRQLVSPARDRGEPWRCNLNVIGFPLRMGPLQSVGGSAPASRGSILRERQTSIRTHDRIMATYIHGSGVSLRCKRKSAASWPSAKRDSNCCQCTVMTISKPVRGSISRKLCTCCSIGLTTRYCGGIADVPDRRGFMQHDRDNHCQDDQCIDFQKDSGKCRYSHFREHQKVQERFLWPAGGLDGGGAGAQVVCKASRQPPREDEVH